MANRPPTHPLVKKFEIDPEGTNDRLTLVGFPGPSPNESHWRIYHDLGFRSCTDVPRKAITHVEPIDAGNEHGPSIVRIKPKTAVQVVRDIQEHDGSGFLAGRIAHANLADAASGRSPTPVGGTYSVQISHMAPCCP